MKGGVIMQTEERFKALFNATPAQLAAVDAALAGRQESERPSSLRLFRMGQAAKETTLSRCTIWRAIREGRLKAIEVRKGSLRIPEDELRRFVEGR
jgi:excisionase family DNA binding protein